MGAKLTVQQKDIIHNMFMKIDANKDGRLSVREVADRFHISYDKAYDFVKKNDKNHDEMLDEQEFTRIVEKHVVCTFKKFDKDGSGVISSAEAKAAIENLHLKGVDAQEFVRRLDTAKDGCISFDEFLNGLFVELAVQENSLLD